MSASVSAVPAVAAAPASQSALCASCGQPLHGPYCHACGEKRLDRHDYALGHFLEHAVDTVTHFDLKVVKGLVSLLLRPGRMTLDVLQGRRVAWPKPLQLFLIVNVLYVFVAHRVGMQVFNTPLRFHLQNWYGEWAQARMQALAAAKSLPLPQLTEQFNHLADTLSKTLIFVFIPLLAGVLSVLLWRQRRYFLEHVLVATHLISQILLVSLVLIGPYVLLMLLLGALHVQPSYNMRDNISTVLLLSLITAWAYPLVRGAYGLSRLAALGTAAGLALGFLWLLMNVYRLLLFVVTYWLL